MAKLISLFSLLALFVPSACALGLVKTASGLIYGDDFNDGVPDLTMWEVYRDDVGITVEETGGEVANYGMPGGNCPSGCGNGFVGYFATPYCRAHPVTVDAVMAGKLRIPSALDNPLNPTPGSLIQFHYCNINPDVNVSVGFQNNYCTYMDPRSVKVTFGGCQLLPASLLRAGFKVYISYNDGFAKAYIDGGDSVLQLGDSVATNLDNNKRMELKALGLNRAESLDYRYDWAVVYKQPRDFPVVLVPDADLKSGGALIARLTFAGQTVTGTGTDTIKLTLPERICYPVAATLELLNGSVSRGTGDVATDNQLQGLYPGDMYRVTSAPSGITALPGLQDGQGLSIWPNPFSRRTVIRVQGAPHSAQVAVYSIAGKKVFQAGGGTVLTWDASGLPQGLYFVRAESEGRAWAQKLLLEK